MLPSIFELELCTLPRTPGTPFDGKDVAQRCRSDTGLPETAVLGLSFIPDRIDVQNLHTSITKSELGAEEFLAYCAESSLEPNTDNERSAAAFLAYAEGQRIAWLHLPAEESGLEMARILVGWAARNGMQLRDGARTYEPLTEIQVYALWQRSDA